MTALAVIGMGMISPLGLTPAEHAFFARAEVGPATSGAFLDEEGEPIHVAACPWLGARMETPRRLCALGLGALDRALAPLRRAAPEERPAAALHVCTAAPRDGLGEADRRAVEEALASAVRPSHASRLTGEAGFFQGLASARAALEGGERAVVIVAVDSLVSPALLASWRRAATTPWDANLPRPAEGAAAVLLMTPAEARREGLEPFAIIHYSAVLRGESSDDNDRVVDGGPMTALLRGVPGRVAASFGQHGTGTLRRREWDIAAARNAASIEATAPFLGLEGMIGCLGAAAGAMSFVYGAAVKHHGAWPDPEDAGRDGTFVAWAISADGTRGLCAATSRGGA